MSEDVERIAARLSAFDKERLLGWQGPPGAAYNAVSEDLEEMGLLDRRWAHTVLGLRVTAHLESQRP